MGVETCTNCGRLYAATLIHGGLCVRCLPKPDPGLERMLREEEEIERRQRRERESAMAGCPHGMTSAAWCGKCQEAKQQSVSRQGLVGRVGTPEPVGKRPAINKAAPTNPYLATFKGKPTRVIPNRFDQSKCKICEHEIQKGDPVFMFIDETGQRFDKPVWVCVRCWVRQCGGTWQAPSIDRKSVV